MMDKMREVGCFPLDEIDLHSLACCQHLFHTLLRATQCFG